MRVAATSYLDGSGLPARWLRRERFVVLDTDFGDGERLLACWQAWRADRPLRLAEAGRRGTGMAGGQLHVIAIAPRVPQADWLRSRWSAPQTAAAAPPRQPSAAAPTDAAKSALADRMLADWPPAVPGLHRLAFDHGDVQLLLAAGGGARDWLPRLSARVDAFFIDGETLGADGDPSWPLRLFKATGRLAASAATLVVPEPSEAARSALRTAGFVPTNRPLEDASAAVADRALAAGPLWCGHHAPAFARRLPSSRRTTGAAVLSSERHALIVGAGLAGCATAWALAERGWHSTLLDRHEAPAREASGNPGGLFHGVVHAQDGAHAQFNRAAALEAARAVRVAIACHGVAGAVDGLLRIDRAPRGSAMVDAGMRDADLPPGYARLVSAAEASRLAGMPIASACRFFPDGGWVQPAGLARAFIERGDPRVRFRGGVSVASLHRIDGDAASGMATGGGASEAHPAGAAGARWRLIDSFGRLVGESAVVVLAHAGDAAALLPAGSRPRAACGASAAPLQAVRGQTSQLPVADLAHTLPGLLLPRLPIVGSGWLLPEIDGLAVFGATAQVDDSDPTVRASDHAANVSALGRLTGLQFAQPPPRSLQGRTAWRCVAADRLPLIGAVPCDDDQPPVVPVGGGVGPISRAPGLYTFTALGSRGITWAPLGAQVLASLITGAPVPVSRGLIEAVDPARFALRRQRHGPRR